MLIRTSNRIGTRKAITAVFTVATITSGFAPSAIAAESTKTIPQLEGLHERWAQIAKELDAPGIAVAAEPAKTIPELKGLHPAARAD